MRLVFLLLIIPVFAASQQGCFENKAHPVPVLAEPTRKTYELNLAAAEKDYRSDSNNADAIIWLGRRWAYLGEYQKAIAIFTRGISLHPGDARMYRHRGHRYITLRCFDKAIADFKKAASLVKEKPDETEPDGLPNAANTPTSTLQSNIWYHLGLCYFIQGKYKNALKAYRECMKVSTNPDMYVATANWLYITLRRHGKEKQAEKLLATIQPGMELIENKDYLQVLLLHKQKTDIADPLSFLQSEKEGLGLASFGYGLGNYLLLNGKKEQARQVYHLITDSNQWPAFGFIAAEAELARIK